MSLSLLINLVLPHILPSLISRLLPSYKILPHLLPPLILLLPPILSLPKNIYQILNTQSSNPAANAFKNWARRHHPDRPGIGKAGEQLFGEVRTIWEGVKDGGEKKIAYDRFGPQALKWSGCSTYKDYLQIGLRSSIYWYIFIGGSMVFFSIVFAGRGPAFWRYALLLLFFFTELYLLVSPTSASSEYYSWLPTVTFQHVILAHNAFFVLVSLVSRLDSPDGTIMRMQRMVEQSIGEITKRLEGIGSILNAEVDRMFGQQMESVRPHSLNKLVTTMDPSSIPSETLDSHTIELLSIALERLIIDQRIERNDVLRGLKDGVVKLRMEAGEEEEDATVVAVPVGGGEKGFLEDYK